MFVGRLRNYTGPADALHPDLAVANWSDTHATSHHRAQADQAGRSGKPIGLLDAHGRQIGCLRGLA